MQAACLFVLLTVCCGGCSDSGSVDETPPADQLALSPSSLVFDEQEPAKNEFTVTATDGLTWVCLLYTSSRYAWLEWDGAAMAGKFLQRPEREEIPENIKEQLIVELYSK